MFCFFNFNESSVAQERQENVQKIVLEGTERMEDQVRYRLHIVRHQQAHDTTRICVRLRTTFLKALKPYHTISTEWV